MILAELGVKYDEAYYVGDSDTDYMTAINSSLYPFIVTYGFKSKDYLIKNGVKNLVDKVEDLLDYIT